MERRCRGPGGGRGGRAVTVGKEFMDNFDSETVNECRRSIAHLRVRARVCVVVGLGFRKAAARLSLSKRL